MKKTCEPNLELLKNVPKMEKDGRIAVLYSPGYGAGWSTWNNDEFRLLLTTHKDIVQCVLDGEKEKAGQVAEKLIREATGNKDEHVYTGGAEDLEVEWMGTGSTFEIREYDGSESIHYLGGGNYLTV